MTVDLKSESLNTKPTIGVGPHPLPWPTDSFYDKDLLEKGDRRNVLDKYRYWTIEAIRADLNKSHIELHIAIENWQHDFNIGTIVRTANAFNVDTVHIIGKRHWNRRGAMVTDRYINIKHHDTVAAFVREMNLVDKDIIAVDIIKGAVALSESILPRNTVLVFGGEGPGLSEEMIQASSKIVMIEQIGSTRSINVGVAAGIVMYKWVQQYALTR